MIARRGWSVSHAQLAAAALVLWPASLLAGPPEDQAIQAAASDPAQPVASTPIPAVASDWARELWRAARTGAEARFYELLSTPPTEGAGDLARLGASVELFRGNLAKRDDQRRAKLDEVGARLDETLAKPDTKRTLSDALRDAVELQMLSIDKPAVLSDPRVRQAVSRAETMAREAEAAGDWLTASELFSRLDTLHDADRRYLEDVHRVFRRLSMISLYDPQRLWTLRNEARVAEGLAPLPPFNPARSDYRQRLAGVDARMVQWAVARSAEYNVHGERLDELMRAGLESVRTLVSTSDLEGVFPQLADAGNRDRFLAMVDAEDERLARLGPQAGQGDLSNLVRRLRDANRESVGLPEEAILHEFGNGAMSALDEFSQIIWPDELPRFQRSTQGSFVGIGVQIQLDEMSNIRIVTPLEGTPAQRAGIRAGDVIKAVNGESAIGLSLDQAVEVITGPANTGLTVTVERDDPESGKVSKDFDLRRAVIALRSVKGWRRMDADDQNWDWFVDGDSGIAYIRLTQFQESTAAELDRAIESIRLVGARGVILDLRYNPGGLLDQAVLVTSRFVDPARALALGGMVVTTQDALGRPVQKPEMLQGGAHLASIPVVVLVNEGSASASEIVAGAIQDYSGAGALRGVLMGQRSYGKGSVQNVWPIATTDAAALKLTTQYYRLPAGRLIHHHPGRTAGYGVSPDMQVEMLPDQIQAALDLRQDADVVPLDEMGRPVADAQPVNPDDLLTGGSDLQLQAALVLLQSQAVIPGQGRASLNSGPVNR